MSSESDTEAIEGDGSKDKSRLRRWGLAATPIVLLAVAIALLFASDPFSGVRAGAPLPDLAITYVEIPNSEVMVVHVINNGPAPVTISQVLVDEAYWGFEMAHGADRTLAPMERATMYLPYHTTPGFDYEIALLTADGATFHHTIVAASTSPGFSSGLLGTMAIIGLFVGVIPVALGMLWFSTMERMKDRTLHAVLAFSAGILAFLVFDAGFEAFELGREAVPGAYEGPILVVLAIIGSMILVQALMDWAEGEHRSGLVIAYGVAVGIGLHNLAEGLAIGSSFAQGRVALGAFLVLGFMVHNVTEGPAIVAPVARGERPALKHFVAMGAIAGVPTIAGGWIGSLAYSPTLGALFLAIGVGALLQVIVDISGIIKRAGTLGTASNLLGFLVGFVIMYITDLFVAL